MCHILTLIKIFFSKSNWLSVYLNAPHNLFTICVKNAQLIASIYSITFPNNQSTVNIPHRKVVCWHLDIVFSAKCMSHRNNIHWQTFLKNKTKTWNNSFSNEAVKNNVAHSKWFIWTKFMNIGLKICHNWTQWTYLAKVELCKCEQLSSYNHHQ